MGLLGARRTEGSWASRFRRRLNPLSACRPSRRRRRVSSRRQRRGRGGAGCSDCAGAAGPWHCGAGDARDRRVALPSRACTPGACWAVVHAVCSALCCVLCCELPTAAWMPACPGVPSPGPPLCPGTAPPALRQLADFLAAPLARAGGIMPLPDVYCLYNRARGTELVSPDDLLRAVALFEQVSCAGWAGRLALPAGMAMAPQAARHATELGRRSPVLRCTPACNTSPLLELKLNSEVPCRPLLPLPAGGCAPVPARVLLWRQGGAVHVSLR